MGRAQRRGKSPSARRGIMNLLCTGSFPVHSRRTIFLHKLLSQQNQVHFGRRQFTSELLFDACKKRRTIDFHYVEPSNRASSRVSHARDISTTKDRNPTEARCAHWAFSIRSMCKLNTLRSWYRAQTSRRLVERRNLCIMRSRKYSSSTRRRVSNPWFMWGRYRDTRARTLPELASSRHTSRDRCP